MAQVAASRKPDGLRRAATRFRAMSQKPIAVKRKGASPPVLACERMAQVAATDARISERVLKLTCTQEDMLPLADACGFTGGSFQREYAGRLHRWDPSDRAHLLAAYFLLYGLTPDDAEYMLSTFQGIHEPTPLRGDESSTASRILRELERLQHTEAPAQPIAFASSCTTAIRRSNMASQALRH